MLSHGTRHILWPHTLLSFRPGLMLLSSQRCLRLARIQGQAADAHQDCRKAVRACLPSAQHRLQRRCTAAAVEEVAAPCAPSSLAASPLFLVYDTMSRSKVPFTPRHGEGNKVSMYVCGVTVYDYSHIGHARVYIAFDVLFRWLTHLGYDVTYVRNFTDIDDKIINRAAESGEEPLELAQRFCDEFHADMDALNCLRPTLEPRATHFVPQMVTMIRRIIDNGHAYEIDGDVYFDVESLAGYGRLSGRAQDDNRVGERVAVDRRKKSGADFALWKAAKPGEPQWDSPWGPGRPGWHIECSSMIREVMGPVIDIHGGGRDLVFPHHENEIAQSEAAASCCDKEAMKDGVDFVRYWMHNGFVNVDSNKMSKSLGNFFTIREVLHQYHPLALRWLLVGVQYRQPVNYGQRALEEASDRVYYLFQTIVDAQELLASAGEGGKGVMQEAAEKLGVCEGPGYAVIRDVTAALCDDLCTPHALAALSTPLKTMNDLMHTKKGRKTADRVFQLSSYLLALESSLNLLGLWTQQPQDVLQRMRELALVRAGLTESEVLEKIQQRSEARKNKDFATSDAVRDSLSAVGIAIMDMPTGTTWRPAPILDVAQRE